MTYGQAAIGTRTAAAPFGPATAAPLGPTTAAPFGPAHPARTTPLAQTKAFASVVVHVMVAANPATASATSTNTRMFASLVRILRITRQDCLARVRIRIIDQRQRDIVLRCNIGRQSAVSTMSPCSSPFQSPCKKRRAPPEQVFRARAADTTIPELVFPVGDNRWKTSLGPKQPSARRRPMN